MYLISLIVIKLFIPSKCEVVKIKNPKIITLLIAFSLLTSGCWSKKELNELAIVTALGVDKIDDEYEVSVQIINPSEIASQGSPTGNSPVATYHAKGKSVFEAIRKLSQVTPRKAYFAHLQMLIIGNELAVEGITQTVDLLARDPETRDDFDVIISNETTAKSILNVLTPVEKIPAFKMLNSLKTSEKVWGNSTMVHIDDLVNAIRSERGFVLSTIDIQGNTELGMDKTNVERVSTPVLLKYEGLSLFKKDKLTGFLTVEESKGYNFLKNNITSTIEIISCPKGGVLATEITKSETKIKGNYNNGNPKFFVKIKVDQNVGEVNCKIDLTNKNSIKYINKESATKIKEEVETTLYTIQKVYQLDIVGFDQILYRQNPKEWSKIKDKWPNLFSNLEVNVKVEAYTRNSGTFNR